MKKTISYREYKETWEGFEKSGYGIKSGAYNASAKTIELDIPDGFDLKREQCLSDLVYRGQTSSKNAEKAIAVGSKKFRAMIQGKNNPALEEIAAILEKYGY